MKLLRAQPCSAYAKKAYVKSPLCLHSIHRQNLLNLTPPHSVHVYGWTLSTFMTQKTIKHTYRFIKHNIQHVMQSNRHAKLHLRQNSIQDAAKCFIVKMNIHQEIALGSFQQLLLLAVFQH